MVNTRSDYRQEPYDACHSVLVNWEKFQRLDAPGPTWLANFLELEGEDREFTQLDAFERVSGLIQALGLP